MTDIGDEDEEGMSFVIYGRSGTGKTTLAADFPKPMLYIDINDRGTKSIKDLKGIKRYRVTSFEQFEEAYWWLKENPDRYKTVVIDTVSQLQAIVVKETHDAKKGSAKKTAGDWGSMTKRDWGDVAALMKEWITNYRDLVDDGMDVVFVAQDRTFNLSDEDEDDDEQLAPEIGPGLSPSIAKAINAAVDLIGNTFIRSRIIKPKPEKGKKVSAAKGKEVIDFCLRVGPSSLYITKVRKPKSQVAPEVVPDPRYEDLLAIIEGDY